MAIITSFLCWSNTRTGSAVCGYYTLIISVVCLAFYMLRYVALDEINDSVELKGIVYAGFVLYSFLIGVSLVLLPGVYMDRKYLLLPWIYVLVITILYETGAIALVTTVHLEQDNTLHVWEVIALVFYCVRLIANCYSFACVVSQYQELSEGRGTFEFLFKPRRRHANRSVRLSDSEEYSPPYGATLPPYSQENPYKDYSPPNYENLSVEFGDLGVFATSFSGDTSTRPDRLRTDVSSSCLDDVVVSSPLSDYDFDTEVHSEQIGGCHNRGANFSHISFGGRSEISDSQSSPKLPGYCHEQTTGHHQYSYHGNQQRGNNFTNDIALSMTSSSAYLMEAVSDSFTDSSMKPTRSKRVPISPLTIQKRTYITWI